MINKGNVDFNHYKPIPKLLSYRSWVQVWAKGQTQSKALFDKLKTKGIKLIHIMITLVQIRNNFWLQIEFPWISLQRHKFTLQKIASIQIPNILPTDTE